MLAYYLLAAAIGSKDREVLQAHLQEYAAIYDNGGVPALRNAIQQESNGQRTFFIRLVNSWNDVTLLNVPDEWITFKNMPSGLAGIRQRVGFVRIPKNAEKDFLIASMLLPDNSVLQVGRSTDSRQALLDPVRRNFAIFGQRYHPSRICRRCIFRPSRHAAHPPGRRHRPFDHSNRPT